MNELVRDWKAEKKDLEEAFDIISDKLVKADAEIERLKESAKYDAFLREKYRALITELCDALEEEFGESRDLTQSQRRPWNLILQGRESTR